MTDAINEIRKLIKKYKRFAVTGHQNPDGDAVGACYAVGMALHNMGKTVSVVLERYARKFDIIPGSHLLYNGPLDDLNIDVLICLDCADKRRMGEGILLFNKARVTVCVDHHETNPGYAICNYLDGNASSTCEMIFRLLDGFTVFDKDISAALYAGLVYDTGGFRFSAVTRDTLDIAGKLIETGIPFSDIYNELLHVRSHNAAILLARIINESRLKMDGRMIYACVTVATLRETEAVASDLDGAAEFLLNTRGVEIAALLYERSNGEVKVSLRSRTCAVDWIATSLGGGGHKFAAGCTVFGAISSVTERVTALMELELNGKRPVPGDAEASQQDGVPSNEDIVFF